MITNISVVDKVAKKTDESFFVAQNSNHTVHFEFDSEWDEYQAKTARFILNGEYQDTLFTGTDCAVPIFETPGDVQVGVYAGNIKTSTPAHVECKKAITSDAPTHYEPTPDVYDEIMDAINSGMLKGEKGDKGDKGDKGEDGEVEFTTFEVDPQGDLYMYYSDDILDYEFLINSNGELEVVI